MTVEEASIAGGIRGNGARNESLNAEKIARAIFKHLLGICSSREESESEKSKRII